MEVDGKPSIGMPPPVPIVLCCVCYPKSRGYLGVLFGERGCLCCVWHSNSLGHSREGGSGSCLGPLALHKHTKFEVSSFSRFGIRRLSRTDHRITDRIIESPT